MELSKEVGIPPVPFHSLNSEVLAGTPLPEDHTRRNFYLRCLAMESGILDDTFIMSHIFLRLNKHLPVGAIPRPHHRQIRAYLKILRIIFHHIIKKGFRESKGGGGSCFPLFNGRRYAGDGVSGGSASCAGFRGGSCIILRSPVYFQPVSLIHQRNSFHLNLHARVHLRLWLKLPIER